MIAKVQNFVAEVGVELKKVSWPTRRELWESSWLVILTSLTLGIFIASADFVLSQLLKMVIR